jgi:hypothetical protein
MTDKTSSLKFGVEKFAYFWLYILETTGYLKKMKVRVAENAISPIMIQ